MGSITGIDWCDSTFNPWIGCQKVSAGCDNCYAETLMDKRWGRVQWGPHGERLRTSENLWRSPRSWQRHHEAFEKEHGHRRRVFCASLADVFDNRVPEQWRWDLWQLIEETPDLDWLLLTKRPENIGDMLGTWKSALPPANVWLGTTCEDQAAFDRRWPIMLEIPCTLRFISYEPAIGPLTITTPKHFEPDWVICGGESGAGYREMDPEWARRLKHECFRKDIPFFMKQMAGNAEIPPELMLREFPRMAA